jgi:hypothetical protein
VVEAPCHICDASQWWSLWWWEPKNEIEKSKLVYEIIVKKNIPKAQDGCVSSPRSLFVAVVVVMVNVC